MIGNVTADEKEREESNYTHALEYCEHVGTLADDIELETLLSNHSNNSIEYWLPIRRYQILKWNTNGGMLDIVGLYLC